MITYDSFVEKFKGLTKVEFEERIIEKNERYPYINIKELSKIVGGRKNVEIVPYSEDGELRYRCFVLVQDGIVDLDQVKYSELFLSDKNKFILKFHPELINQDDKEWSNYFKLELFTNAREVLERQVEFLKNLEKHYINTISDNKFRSSY